MTSNGYSTFSHSFQRLCLCLDEAGQHGYLPDPGLKISLKEEHNRANTRSYILAIKSRLIDLGYLNESEQNRNSVSIDNDFKQAVKKFQKDARLKNIDAWVGPKTWHVLQQLVSFEDQQEPYKWTILNDHKAGCPEETFDFSGRKSGIRPDNNLSSNGQEYISNKAVIRAAYLRLYALGFFPYKEKLDPDTDLSLLSNKIFQKALDDFFYAGSCLGLIRHGNIKHGIMKSLEIKCNGNNECSLSNNRMCGEKINCWQGITVDILNALFNQDKIVLALSRHPEFVRNKKNRKFIIAVARIELWLMGFDLRISGPCMIRDFDSGFSSAMNEFMINQHLPDGSGDFDSKCFDENVPIMSEGYTADPESDNFAKKWIDEEKYPVAPFPAFFNALVDMEIQEKMTDDSIEESLLERIRHFSGQEKQELEGRLKNIASSIWDGVKRVFLWMKKFIRDFSSKISNMIKNVARFIAGRARRYFVPVRKAFEIIYRGSVYFKNSIFPESLPGHIVIWHDKDFDAKMFINTNGNQEVIQRVIERNYFESMCFSAACRISGYLAAIFRQTVEILASGALGWFIALLTLAGLGSQLKHIKEDLEMVESFEISPGESPFLNSVV